MPHRRLQKDHSVHMSTEADERVMEVEFDDLRLGHNEGDENIHNQTVGDSRETHGNRDDILDEDEDIDEYYSEEDERPTAEDYRQYGMYQSLPLPPGPPDMEAPCDTAEEYLRRVRYEAEQLPTTVTSHIDPRQYDAQRTEYVPAQDSEAMTAADCMPSMQWLQDFLADFAALRAQLHKEDEDFDPFLPQAPPPPPPHPLPHHMDENAWKWYCLGHQSSQPAQAAETSDMAEESTQPSNGVQSAESAVAAQDSTQDMLDNDADSTPHQVQAHSADANVDTDADMDMQAAGESQDAAMQPESVTEAKHATPQGMAPQMAVLASLDQVMLNRLLQWHISWALVKESFNELSTRWLYAVLAQIDKPVTVASSSQLSSLLRHCIKLRNQVTDTNSVDLLPLHLLIALAGGYFGQDGTLASFMQPLWL